MVAVSPVSQLVGIYVSPIGQARDLVALRCPWA
jgi:hypothetical protein